MEQWSYDEIHFQGRWSVDQAPLISAVIASIRQYFITTSI